MPFREVDVSRDHRAGQEMVRLSGQSSVPVTVAGNDVIIGFDQRRLEALAGRVAAATTERPRLGMQIRDAQGGGAEVGPVRAGSPAEQAGVRTGDTVVEVEQQAVASAADFERRIGLLARGSALDVVVMRGTDRLRVRIHVS